MKIHVPENLGAGKLRILPEDTYKAVVSDAFHKIAGSGKPVCYFRWTLKSECTKPNIIKDPNYISTVGEAVLDSYSLQEQAFWRIASDLETLTGESLPEGDYDSEDPVKMIKENVVGCEASIRLEVETTNKGNQRMKVAEIIK